MVKKNLIFIPLLIGIIFSTGFFSNLFVAIGAQQNIAHWYIQNFESKIIVNKDSSLNITERITADCGKAMGKHGIFRVLPEQILLTSG